MIFLLLLLAAPAEAKRVMPMPAAENPFPDSEVRNLARRVAGELKRCVGAGNEAAVEFENKTALVLAPGLVANELHVGGKKISIKAELTFHEWKSGKYLWTYTLKARAFEGAKKLCEKVHRTVRKRDAPLAP